MNNRCLLVSAALLATVGVAACTAHPAGNAAAVPPNSPAAPASSPERVISASAAPPSANSAPCPSDSGWTGKNLSTAPPNPAAWLTPAQMPDAAVYQWTPQGTPVAQPFAQDVWNQLYSVDVSDYLAWQVQDYKGSARGSGAGQTIFLYSSAAQASCAYQNAAAGAADNQAQSLSVQIHYGISPDAVTTEVVSGEHDSAWTESWTGPSIPPVTPGPQTDVEYMAQVGTAVTFVGFEVPGLDQSIPDTTAAQAVLSTIIQRLSVYQSAS